MATVSAAETGQSRRKGKILRAARELVSEFGEGGLVMRTLAERAGVSLATPYNLFGSKSAILLQLFQDHAESFQKIFESKSSSDKLLKIFELNDFTYDFYNTEAGYFASLLSALYKSQNADLRASVLRPRTNFLKQMIRDCIADGILDPSTNAVLLSRLMVAIHSHVAQDWAAGSSSTERARLDVAYGHAVVLLSASTRRSTQRLLELQQNLQVNLEELIGS